MKNSNRSGIGSYIRRSVSILLIFATLAITNVAKAGGLKNSPANEGASVSSTHLSDRGSTFSASRLDSADASPEDTPRLIAWYWAYSCVTVVGTFPLDAPVVSGSLCYVPSYNVFGRAW